MKFFDYFNKAIYKMNQDEEDDTNPEKETERIFKIMDKNNDNSISLEG
jgi:hypothetical protein